jgi:hypothetical protein
MFRFPDALLVETLVMVVAAPAAGALVRSPRPLFTTGSALLGASDLAQTMATGSIDGALAAHATLAAACLALASFGVACRRFFTDPLDRIAVAGLIGLSAAFGLFAFGALTTTWPTSLLNVLLVLNPVVAVASASGVDIFHGALLYQISPIAHREFSYPAWPLAAAVYACAAGATLLAVARVRRSGARGMSYQLSA